MSETARGEEELACRLQHGDREALAVLFSRHRERLWRMVNFRMDPRLFSRVDPDDVLQEAYLAAADRLGHYGAHARASPFVWLRMNVMQTLTDLHRHHLHVQKRGADREATFFRLRDPQTTSASLAALLLGQFTSPSQAAARAEMLDRVERAISAMEPLDREVLALRHFEELTNTEVAEVLGIQQKAASIRYVRALERLKAVMSRLPEFSEEQGDVGPRS